MAEFSYRDKFITKDEERVFTLVKKWFTPENVDLSEYTEAGIAYKAGLPKGTDYRLLERDGLIYVVIRPEDEKRNVQKSNTQSFITTIFLNLFSGLMGVVICLVIEFLFKVELPNWNFFLVGIVIGFGFWIQMFMNLEKPDIP